MNPEVDQRLRRLLEGPRQIPGASCPAAEEWASLAAGLVSEERRETLLDHAAGCDSCGPLLREISEDFGDEITDKEAEDAASLRTGTLAGQRELARKMAERSRRRAYGAWNGWLAKAAVILICAGVGWMGYERWQAGAPETLIAQAYTEQRPFVFRVHGASYAPLRAERGVGSRLDRPHSLLAAEAAIAGKLKDAPDSAKWLGLRARTEMLNHDPEEAIATLRRALDQSGEDQSLLADLGMAYALRAESAARSGDYEYAIEYLGRALKADPQDAAALYNRAVVYERMFLFDLAAEDWQRYLVLDSKGGWAEEARSRLRDIEQKKKPDNKP